MTPLVCSMHGSMTVAMRADDGSVLNGISRQGHIQCHDPMHLTHSIHESNLQLDNAVKRRGFLCTGQDRLRRLEMPWSTSASGVMRAAAPAPQARSFLSVREARSRDVRLLGA